MSGSRMGKKQLFVLSARRNSDARGILSGNCRICSGYAESASTGIFLSIEDILYYEYSF